MSAYKCLGKVGFPSRHTQKTLNLSVFFISPLRIPNFSKIQKLERVKYRKSLAEAI